VEKNQLYYGDNLEVLRQHIKDESVDLIYLDPPFNSRQDYNVLFAEKDGTRSSSQIMAFEDTWEWNVDAERPTRKLSSRAAASPTPPLVALFGCRIQYRVPTVGKESLTG
jgi:16S rRNA G966 N2-methylase RsmD